MRAFTLQKNTHKNFYLLIFCQHYFFEFCVHDCYKKDSPHHHLSLLKHIYHKSYWYFGHSVFHLISYPFNHSLVLPALHVALDHCWFCTYLFFKSVWDQKMIMLFFYNVFPCVITWLFHFWLLYHYLWTQIFSHLCCGVNTIM